MPAPVSTTTRRALRFLMRVATAARDRSSRVEGEDLSWPIVADFEREREGSFSVFLESYKARKEKGKRDIATEGRAFVSPRLAGSSKL